MEKVEGMAMPSKDVRKLQLIELEIMLEVDRICRKNNIRYYLHAGSLLGAVRHEGFIPWDDDLDITMTREEFIKFCEVCKTELDTKRFFLQTHKTDMEYRWGYAKVRRRETEYVRLGQERIKCMSGVSMDIFILDNIPDSVLGKVLYHYVRRVCIKTLYSVIGADYEKTILKKMLYKVLKYIPKEIPLGIMETMAKVSNSKRTKYVCCLSFYRMDGFINKRKLLHRALKSEWLSKRTEICFEGFLFYTYEKYIEYLEHEYKKFWTYPPKEQRFLHPPLKYDISVDIDLRGKSYKEFMGRDPKYKTLREILALENKEY